MEEQGPCVVKVDMSTAVLSSVDEADAMPALCFGIVSDEATKVRSGTPTTRPTHDDAIHTARTMVSVLFQR